MDMQKFVAKCASEGRDPVEMLGHLHRWLKRLQLTNAPLYQFLYAEFAKARTPSEATGPASMTEEEPYFPCGWCRNRDLWGDDYCGWGHWFICDWWGYGCVDCGGEPPPPPEG